jgi:tectonin beta-propeller repeat-containing protein 1
VSNSPAPTFSRSTCSNFRAVGYDFTPYVYTGGWGGSHFKGVETSKHGIHAMEDTKYYYVYENQRWNPLTGFNAHGLPTDRYVATVS